MKGGGVWKRADSWLSGQNLERSECFLRFVELSVFRNISKLEVVISIKFLAISVTLSK